MKLIPADPVHLNFRGKLLSALACFIAILVVAWASQLFKLDIAYPIIVASMGPTALMLFFIPNSPLAQPWPLIGGHLISAFVGVTCAQLIPDTVFASAFAVSGSVASMLLLRCLHPPGAATALTPVLSGALLSSLGYDYVLMPVGLNVAIMIMMAVAFNRWLLCHEYPTKTTQAIVNKRINTGFSGVLQRTRVSEQDVEQALQEMNTFMDVTSADLSRLLTNVEQHRFIQKSGAITCADIMDRNCFVVEYGTDVEEAWHLMLKENLQALTVIDRSRRVIGIITWHDFFKFIKIDAEQTLQEKILAFIKRTSDISTNKPESVGQIMTTKVVLLKENAHIVDLIPLMATSGGYKQIPIINGENRLAGIAYQGDLIAMLYTSQTTVKLA